MGATAHRPSSSPATAWLGVAAELVARRSEDRLRQRRRASSDRRALYSIHVMNADGTGDVTLTSSASETVSSPAWSPDGSKIVYQRFFPGPNRAIHVMNADGSGDTQIGGNPAQDTDPDWQPVVTGYPRPKGATPLRVALVPGVGRLHSLRTASTGRRWHSRPAASPSQASPNLTVGTPDANGAAANFQGFVRHDVPRQATPRPAGTTLRCWIDVAIVRRALRHAARHHVRRRQRGRRSGLHRRARGAVRPSHGTDKRNGTGDGLTSRRRSTTSRSGGRWLCRATTADASTGATLQQGQHRDGRRSSPGSCNGRRSARSGSSVGLRCLRRRPGRRRRHARQLVFAVQGLFVP